MEHTPEEIQRMQLEERLPCDVQTLAIPAILRRLNVIRARKDGGFLLLYTSQLPDPLVIATSGVLTFGTESITALDYFSRVIEQGDMIDAAVFPLLNGAFPVKSFWIHIEYAGTTENTSTFSQKDDGLFAMRAKSGEKAERVVTRILRDKFGHVFPEGMCDSPGFFEIRYTEKKFRKPDRKCLACALTFEVKKRNKDQHFRVSHSPRRSFLNENSASGWHAFVFPDMSAHFVPNAAIAQAINEGRYTQGQDQYDSWADVDSVESNDPPHCPGWI